MGRGLVTVDVYQRLGHDLGEGRCGEFVEGCVS